MSQPPQPLSDAKKQAVRLRRFLLAGLTYVLGGALVVTLWVFGLMAGAPAATALAAMTLANLAFYVTFRAGLNLRFADPSLTQLQMLVALTIQMFIIYHMDEGRGLGLVFTFIVFLFGVYRLSRREFVALTLYAVAAYALVINLLLYLRPEVVHNVYVEWFSWLLLACVLPWFGMMGGRMHELRERLRAQHDELVRAYQTIHQMATRDSLTGLLNRASLTEGLQQALARAGRYGGRVGLLFLDLDRFKAINDTLGHAAGDRVLREVAARLKGCVRSSDLAARLGGDEFVVAIENYRDAADLEIVARKIVEAVAQPVPFEDSPLPVSVSVGVATAAQDGSDAPALLRHADAAMYRAKQSGRNRYAVYDAQLDGADAA